MRSVCSCVSYGKDSIIDITNYLIAKASKGIFTTVNASVYSNASQYSTILVIIF